MRALYLGLFCVGVASCGASARRGGGGSAAAVPDAANAGATGTPTGTASTEQSTAGTPRVGCGPSDPAGIRGCVEPERFKTDLTFIAKPRPNGTKHWQAVQDLCADRFAELEYTVERHSYGSGVNVIGVRTGKSRPDEQVLVSAHYDSVPKCSGADDNGSGVAGVLEIARVLAMSDHARTTVVACWDEEERGLLGSTAYADRAKEHGDTIVMSFVLEMIAYTNPKPETQSLPFGFELVFPDLAAELKVRQNRADFIAFVVGDDSPEATAAFASHAEAVALPQFPIVLDATQRTNSLYGDLNSRSDHAGFWRDGFPAVMITDTSEFRYPHYHCRQDNAVMDSIEDVWPVKSDDMKYLDLDFAANVVRATVGAAAVMLQ